ncbi:uncharacterized protein LOC123530850 [Mercenaria mercenaria]|uniref:uncharacterized protein LOC123530850 n=1 Tax=Mercenaria mercenaria TaxID=6596 RepID=UPI00234EF16E|nr:uncharacterized protein LOC123530850 [Mercenaria mercenaria]
MPPATGLQFYRKRQTIDQLALERPQSLPIFRTCVLKALVAVDRRIDLLQQSYYGPENDIEQEIKRWLGPLSKVLKESKISFFLCKTQLDDAVQKFRRSEGDPTMVVDFDKEAIRTVIDIVERVTQYLKTGFADIIKDLKLIGDYMWKYCLSFSSAEGDLYLDTAVNYERQRKEFSQAINFNLDDITNMAEQFETKGMRTQELGFVARDLAERCKATHAPFLVIIPQAFENLRHAVAGMRKWIEADDGYSDFIKCDIDEMEIKRDNQEKLVRDMQIKCSNCDHKLKTAKRHLVDITAEVKSFKNREVLLSKERDELIAENKDVLVDLDIKVFRKEEMKKRLETLSDFELEKFKQLDGEIQELSEKRPVIEKKLHDLNKKLDLIRDRKDTMTKREKEVGETYAEVKKIKKEFRKCEVELGRLDGNLSRLKEIYRYKTTPEILKKIFHGMPLTARHVVNKGKRPIMDKLERCCKITASKIDTDWTRLYRALPFHPARGEQTILKDVDEIGKEYMRHIPDEMCRQSLWRWRRMHTRASVEDLKKALLSIKRKDIVEAIDEDIVRQANKPNIPSPAFRTIRFPKLKVHT